MSANFDRDLPVQNSRYSAATTKTCHTRHAGYSKHLRVFGGLLFLALSASLVGQSHFCIGGDVDHLTPATVAACKNKLSAVRNAVRQHGAPSDWHFVVVCDDEGWKEYTSFSSREAGLLSGASYSTDPRLHWTFLRGGDLDQPDTTASVVTMALTSVPNGNSEPQRLSKTRQYGIAMARPSDSKAMTQ